MLLKDLDPYSFRQQLRSVLMMILTRNSGFVEFHVQDSNHWDIAVYCTLLLFTYPTLYVCKAFMAIPRTLILDERQRLLFTVITEIHAGIVPGKD